MFNFIWLYCALIMTAEIAIFYFLTHDFCFCLYATSRQSIHNTLYKCLKHRRVSTCCLLRSRAPKCDGTGVSWSKMAAKVRLVRPGKVMMLRKIDAVTTARKNRMRPRDNNICDEICNDFTPQWHNLCY